MNKKKDLIIIRPRADENIFKKYVFLNEALVRPIINNRNRHIDDVFTGIILKLPVNKLHHTAFSGDEWKTFLEKESDFKVGDKVLYNGKTNIVMNEETLHLVGWFIGKILK